MLKGASLKKANLRKIAIAVKMAYLENTCQKGSEYSNEMTRGTPCNSDEFNKNGKHGKNDKSDKKSPQGWQKLKIQKEISIGAP